MTKTTLLTATAFAALAFAGAANAQVITTAEVSSQTTLTGGTLTPYAIANESIASVANRRTATAAGANDVVFVTATTAPPVLAANTAYRITYTLSGTATPTFIAQVTAAAITGSTTANNDCIASKSVVAGTGAGGSNTVSFIVNTVAATTGTCTVAAGNTTATSLNIDVPFTIGAIGGVTATVAGSLDPSNTNAAAVNPYTATTGNSTTLVQALQGYRIFADATVDNASEGAAAPDNADFPTQLALATTGAPFRTFVGGAANDQVIGAAGFIVAPIPAGVGAAGAQVFADLSATPLPAANYTLTITPTSGDFSVLKPQTATTDNGPYTDATVAANNLSGTVGTAGAPIGGGARNIGLRIDGAPSAAITATPQTYTVNVTPIGAASTLITRPAAITNQPLETLGLQGSTFVAPWVQSTNASYNTVIRLTNDGGANTGSVQLTIANATGTTTRTSCDSTVLAKLGSITANGELAINSADLTTCFGAFTRANVFITVLSLNNNLTAKMRIVNPGNVVTEQSLGRF